MLTLPHLLLLLLSCSCFDLSKDTNAQNDEITSMPDIIIKNLGKDLDSKSKPEQITDVDVELVDTPRKVGDIEFEVEVRESSEDAESPEIVGFSEKNSSNSKEKLEVKVETINFVATPKKIGQIELDVQVQQVLPEHVSIVPEIDVMNEGVSEISIRSSQISKSIKFSQAFDVSDMDSKFSKASLTDLQTLPMNVSSEAKTLEYDTSVTESDNSSTIQLKSEEPITQITSTLSGTSQTKSVGSQAESKTTTIWPIILLAVLFSLIALMGICWVISAFRKSVKEEVKTETAAAGSASETNRSPNLSLSQDIESGQTSAPASQPESNPSERSSDSEASSTKSSESLEQKSNS